jgi:hypothetical protein
MFGDSTLATLSRRETRVAKRLEVVSEASTPEILLLVSVDYFRLACALSSRPPEQSFALQSARNGRSSLAASPTEVHYPNSVGVSVLVHRNTGTGAPTGLGTVVCNPGGKEGADNRKKIY